MKCSSSALKSVSHWKEKPMGAALSFLGQKLFASSTLISARCENISCCTSVAAVHPPIIRRTGGFLKKRMTTIYVDSRKRVAGSDSDFEVDLGESLHLQSDARLAVYKIRLADSFLSTDRGRYLYWVDAALGTLNWALLPEGAYTGARLAAWISSNFATATYGETTNSLTAALAPTAGEVAGTLAGAAGVGAAATAGLAVGIAGGAAYGLARGTGWVLENTLFRPQQGSEDAAVQDVRSANGMNDATQPQHFSLRSGSSTSGSPASSRASSQSGFRVQAQSNTPRPFSWGLNPVALPQSQPSSRASSSSRRSLPPPSFDQLARDIEAA